MEGCCSGVRVLASRPIIVGQGDALIDAGASDLLRVLIPPALGSACAGRGRYVDGPKRIRVLFTLDEEDGPLIRELGEAIHDALDVAQVPDPAITAVGAPHAKRLRVVPAVLVQQGAVDVAVVVRSNKPPSDGPRRSRRRMSVL